MRHPQMKSTEGLRPPVLLTLYIGPSLGRGPVCVQGFFVGLPNSERAQQHRADEHERRAHRQDIQSYGKVHEQPPLSLCR